MTKFIPRRRSCRSKNIGETTERPRRSKRLEGILHTPGSDGGRRVRVLGSGTKHKRVGSESTRTKKKMMSWRMWHKMCCFRIWHVSTRPERDDCYAAAFCVFHSFALAPYPKIARPRAQCPFRKEEQKKKSQMGLTDTTSSGAPFTIWNSLRINPDGLLLPSFPLGGGGLGAAERLAVARRLMLVLFVSNLFCSLECWRRK